jgi:hypothetical protein
MLDGLPYADIAYGAGSQQLLTDPDGVASGRVFVVSGTNNNSNLLDTRLALPTPHNKIGMGARFYRTLLPATDGTRPVIMGWRTAANARMYDLLVEANGAIAMYNAAGALVASTVVPIFTTNTWQHIEAVIDSTTGLFEVRREGVTVLTGTAPIIGSNIGIVSWTNRQSYNSNTSVTFYMKDLTIWDDLGSYNNDFMGTVSVVTCSVTADESNSGWVPSTGADLYATLDEATPADTDYMSAAAAAASAKFTLTDLPADITSVRAVQTMVRATKTDGGDAKLKVGLFSVAETDFGADRPITPSMTYWWDISEQDPHTSAQWTPGTFNDAALVIDRTV